MIKNTRKGFTTVELVIVIAVIAILATALIPTFGGLINSANKTATEQTVRNAYRDYVAANPTERAGATYLIHDGENYYHVVDGVLSFEDEFVFGADELPTDDNGDDLTVICCDTECDDYDATVFEAE